MATTLENATRTAMSSAFGDTVDGGTGAGYLEFQIAGGTEVATITFTNPCYTSVTNGVLTFDGTPLSDTSATGNGSPVTKASFYTSAATKVAECSAGTAGDITLTSATIGSGDTVTLSSLTFTVPAS